VSGALRKFVEVNQRAGERIEARLPHAQTNLQEAWAVTVADRMKQLPAGSLVVDVGGGRSCLFAKDRAPDDGRRLLAIDISEEELAHNTDVDEKLVADVVEGLPLEDDSADMIVSKSVVEHLADSEAYVAEAARALRPGGWFINFFPSKWAPFSIANRALPEAVSQRLLYYVWPGSEGIVGFPTHYDNCSTRAMGRVLRGNGFDPIETRVSYYQSDYYTFFLPLYLVMVAYEVAISTLNVKQLAASVLMVARKR